MFDELKNHIGEEVRCTFIARKAPIEIKGKLNAINEYKSVVIGHMCIPFIGLHVAVKRIESITNKPYYINTTVTDDYDCKSEDELQLKKESFFGEAYKEKYSKAFSKTLTKNNNQNKR